MSAGEAVSSPKPEKEVPLPSELVAGETVYEGDLLGEFKRRADLLRGQLSIFPFPITPNS